MIKKQLNRATPWIALGFLIVAIRYSFILNLGLEAIPFELIFFAIILFILWKNANKAKDKPSVIRKK